MSNDRTTAPSIPSEEELESHVSRSSEAAAIGLYAVVSAGLAYGVWQTLVKVTALFTG